MEEQGGEVARTVVQSVIDGLFVADWNSKAMNRQQVFSRTE